MDEKKEEKEKAIRGRQVFSPDCKSVLQVALGFLNHLPIECYAVINEGLQQNTSPRMWKMVDLGKATCSIFLGVITVPFLSNPLIVLHIHQNLKYTTNSCVG